MKKIYLEITNNCNLDCNFCLKHHRNKKYMNIEEYKDILFKLENYTKYLYLHVYGEPLIHPNINELIDYGSKNFKINITTNGYLINRIKENHNIRQINISLHSFDSKYKVSIEKYLNNIFEVVDNLKDTTYISYRLWVNTEYTDTILKKLDDKYKFKINGNNIKLDNNVYLDIGKEFVWPSLNNLVSNSYGKCYALKDHIGILVDGTVVPCCLDTEGVINLGNIFTDNLDDILNSKRVQNMLKGFKDNKKQEELCKKCNFINTL